jgi:hypothetical protein
MQLRAVSGWLAHLGAAAGIGLISAAGVALLTVMLICADRTAGAAGGLDRCDCTLVGRIGIVDMNVEKCGHRITEAVARR